MKTAALTGGFNQLVKANAIADKIVNDRLKIISCAAAYNPALSWQDNSSQVREFSGVIVEHDELTNSKCIPIASLDKDAPPYLVATQSETSRTNEDICNLMADLLNSSSHLTLIDPYFSAGNTHFTRTVELILKKHLHITLIEIHCTATNYNFAVQQKHISYYLEPHLNQGTTLRIHHWKQKTDGELPHGRFAITDLGAIQLDPGFDCGNSGEKVQWTLMDYDYSREILNKYSLANAVFELLPDGVIEIVG